MARAAFKLSIVPTSKSQIPYAQAGYRFFKTEYASGQRPGYCKTLESATMAAMQHLMYDGYTSATISCTITGESVARLKMNDDRTKVQIISERGWKVAG
jgi:hypothetical protein